MAIAIAEQIERQANECIANNIPILSFFSLEPVFGPRFHSSRF